MPTEKLTDLQIKRAKVAAGYPKMLSDGRGLYLRVTPSGHKHWIYRYAFGVKQTDLGLGPYPDISLAAAREKALALRRLRHDGKDPLEEKRASGLLRARERVPTITFREAAERYIEAHRAGWRSAHHARQWESTLANDAFPILGDLSVADIDTPLVLRVLSPIWTTKTESASRLRGRIELILGWATANGYRTGDNPARWRGHLEHSLPKPGRVKAPQEERRHPSLPYADTPAFLAKLRSEPGIVAPALEFAILTAARSGEVMGATWTEFDLAGRTWTIPASRMKAKREHRVPLSDAAVAVIERMAEYRTGGLVFPGRHGRLHKDSFPTLLQRIGFGHVTAHGFRSSFADWATERTAYASEMREMALAHNVGTKVEQAYRRTDMFEKRRKMMQDWADFCGGRATESDNVVPLRSA